MATNYEEFKETINTKPGFVKAMWCGNRECEDKIKEDVQATSRCMPFEQEHLSDVCVCWENLPRRWYIGEEHTKIKTYRLWMISQYRKNQRLSAMRKPLDL